MRHDCLLLLPSYNEPRLRRAVVSHPSGCTRQSEQNLKQQVEQERASFNKQSKKLTLLQNDPSYTELLARDKLDLMKPGETIFRMETGH